MEIEHRQSERRFVAPLADGEAELAYTQPREGVLDLQHTYVPPSGRGQGVGDALVEAALEYARTTGQRIIPTCPFVKRWLDSHPEARALVAGPE